MKRRSFIGLLTAITVAGRMTFQPELKLEAMNQMQEVVTALQEIINEAWERRIREDWEVYIKKLV